MNVRGFLGMTTALLSLTVAGASAGQKSSPPPKSPLVGTWHGVSLVRGAPPILIDLILGADGRYGERTKWNGGKSISYGRYAVVGKNLLHFAVVAWEPRQDCSKPAPCDAIPKPPDMEYRVLTVSPTALTMKEKKFGGVIRFTRTR